MMWLLGFIAGASLTGAIAVCVLWRDIKKQETAHDRYVRAVRDANRAWFKRNPRVMRHTKRRIWWFGHMKTYPSPMPMDWR